MIAFKRSIQYVLYLSSKRKPEVALFWVNQSEQVVEYVFVDVEVGADQSAQGFGRGQLLSVSDHKELFQILFFQVNDDPLVLGAVVAFQELGVAEFADGEPGDAGHVEPGFLESGNQVVLGGGKTDIDFILLDLTDAHVGSIQLLMYM
jgi:hypothetical protein